MNSFKYAELSVGQSDSFSVVITTEMMAKFLDITGDVNPLHVDAKYARGGGFSDCVCYGLLTSSFLSTLAGVYLPGENSIIHSVETNYPNPVFVGDQLTISGSIVELNDSVRRVVLKVRIANQKGETVCRGKMKVGLRS